MGFDPKKFLGFDLMNGALTHNISLDELDGKMEKRVSYANGHQAAVNSMLCGFNELLQMEKGKPDLVNLDDPLVWRQKKVKEKAVQFFEILSGKHPKGQLLRIGFDELSKKGYLCGFPECNMFHRYMEEGYSEKTARAQAAQMHSLFSQLRVVVEGPANHRKLVVNPNSLLYEKALRAFKPQEAGANA